MLGHLAWLVGLLGLSPSDIRERLEDRLRVQKAVFLLRYLKVEPFTGYDFDVYLRGPYSPELASDYYRLEGVEPEPVEGADVEIVKWFVSHKPRWLEIASSILWIKEAYPRSKPKEIYSILTLSKPWVGEEEFRRILRELRERSLLNF